MHASSKNKRTDDPVAPLPPQARRQKPVSEETIEARITYQIRHRLPGRLRLIVPELKQDEDAVGAALLSLGSINGVFSVKTNLWAASVLIEYDPEQVTEALILAQVELLKPGGESGIKIPKPSILVSIVRGALHLLDKTLPGTIQLTLGAASFAAGVLGFPTLVTQALLWASVAPMASRALRTALEERKFGVDALDGSAAVLMISTGRFVEAGFMTGLISLGEFIREMTARKCERMVNDLLGLSGRSAWLVRGKKRICIPAEEVVVGDIVVVYPGDMIPIDGSVIRGEAAIDQSKLTGESLPVEVSTGSKVMASTVAVEGKIYIQCEAIGAQTRAALVLDSIASAPISETRIQNYAAMVADRAVVPIFVSAAICFGLTRNLIRLMSMLIFDFSTGIRIAAPTAVLSSMHLAGQRGILIKSGGALERLASIDAIVFDKTGTLTSGEPKVSDVCVLADYSENEVLTMAAAIEERLHHPAARAIVMHALHKGLTIPHRGDSAHMRGMGVRAAVDGKIVAVGSKRMMEMESIDTSAARAAEKRATKVGASLAYVAADGKLIGLITYADKLRDESAQAISRLKKLGVRKLVMATGDGEAAAASIASACGIAEVRARVFPEEKAELVRELKAAGYNVAVIGDGINDSPALAHADVAVSLHGGTEAARHSADVVLTDADLRRLPEAIQIARSSMALVKQNLTLAVVPNSAGLGLAAFGMVGPAGATLLNNGSAIAAALNSLRPLFVNSWSSDKTV